MVASYAPRVFSLDDSPKPLFCNPCLSPNPIPVCPVNRDPYPLFYSHCVVCLLSHQHVGAPPCGNSARAQLSGTIPI